MTKQTISLKKRVSKLEREVKRLKELLSRQSFQNILRFLLSTFQNSWSYTQEQLDLAKNNLNPELIAPDQINWEARKSDTNASKSGEFTLNPETQGLDYERAKVYIPTREELKSFEGKTLSELAKYISDTYSNRYYIPGIEYWQWLSENPTKAPQVLKDSANYYFYFGSILRHRNGNWCVPSSDWNASQSKFDRNASWLDGGWGSYFRVVLLER